MSHIEETLKDHVILCVNCRQPLTVHRGFFSSEAKFWDCPICQSAYYFIDDGELIQILKGERL